MIKQRLITAFQRNLGSSGGVLVNFPGFSLLVQVLEFQHFRISILQQVLREGARGQNVSFLGNEDEIQIPQPQPSPRPSYTAQSKVTVLHLFERLRDSRLSPQLTCKFCDGRGGLPFCSGATAHVPST